MKFGVIFAMGSPMGDYYTTLDAPDMLDAEAEVRAVYKRLWTNIFPYDSRFEAHVRVYQKSEIVFGSAMRLVPPNDPPIPRA